MVLERQTTWGWLIVLGLFFTGAGAGAFTVSFLVGFLNGDEPIATAVTILGPLLVLIGASFFLVDLGSRAVFFRLVSNRASWMSRGVWFITAFIVFGLAYALPSFGPFAWLPWDKSTIFGLAIGIVAAISSLFVLIYGGLLLATAKGVPFWNTPLLPILFLFSGLSCGIALLNLIALFFVSASGQETLASLHMVGAAEIIIILTELLILGAYIEIARGGNISAVESVRLLKTLLFIGGVVLLGLVIPLGLLFYGALITDVAIFSTVVGMAGVLLLVGGVLLRYAIIRAGVYLPLYVM